MWVCVYVRDVFFVFGMTFGRIACHVWNNDSFSVLLHLLITCGHHEQTFTFGVGALACTVMDRAPRVVRCARDEGLK